MDFITSLFESPYFCALFAFPGSILFAMSLKAPKRSLLMSGIGGFVGQFIYVLFCSFTSIYLSVFIATFIACLLSEISSRIFKIPSTVVTYPALVPLVPGLMLYNAMLAFSRSEFEKGGLELVSAIIYTGCMAVAITLSSVIARRFLSPLFKKISSGKANS